MGHEKLKSKKIKNINKHVQAKDLSYIFGINIQTLIGLIF